MAFRRDSHLKQKLFGALPVRFRFNHRLLTGDEYGELALDGFCVLGPIAKPVLPALIGLLTDPDQATRSTAADLLRAIGPSAESAIPELIQMLRSTNLHSQQDAISALGGIHSRPDVVVPELLPQLSAEKPTLNRISALVALACFGQEAKQAAIIVEKLTGDPDPAIRNYATNALRHITLALGEEPRITSQHSTHEGVRR